MFKDPRNPLGSEVLDRRFVLKERIENLLKNPESIVKQEDIILTQKYDNCLVFFLHCPVKDRTYQTVPLDGRFGHYLEIPEENLHRLFCYERSWENEGYNESAPVIEMRDGIQIECAILDLTDFEEAERAIIEAGFNQVQRIVVEENATMLQ